MTAARMVLGIVAWFVGGLLLLAASYGCWRARERITDLRVNFWGPRRFGDDDRTRWAARMGTYGISSFLAFFGVMCVFASIGLVLVWMFNGI